MRVLLDDPHFLVTLSEELHLVRRARTAQRFETLAELEGSYAALFAVFDALDCARYGQLVDARRSPPRNDPEFEEAVSRKHDRLFRGFRASVVLVQSAVGRLQVRRMLEASGVPVPVFTDEAEALAHLARRTSDRPMTPDGEPRS
jgi:hypothetical protein